MDENGVNPDNFLQAALNSMQMSASTGLASAKIEAKKVIGETALSLLGIAYGNKKSMQEVVNDFNTIRKLLGDDIENIPEKKNVKKKEIQSS